MPATVVQSATVGRQRRLVGTLDALPEIAALEKVHPPTLVIVGEVVRLREKLAWFTRVALEASRDERRAKA